MKKETPSSDDIQNTLDNLEKEAEKNLEDAKRNLHWAQNNLKGATSALVSCEHDVNRAQMRMQVIKDLKREKNI